jgi:CheY-like chemotaxis protein
MLERRLKRAGFDVVIARDGAQGVAMALAEQPAMILMDMGTAGTRWLAGDTPDQGRAGNEAHSGHRADVQRDDRRQGESVGRGLR